MTRIIQRNRTAYLSLGGAIFIFLLKLVAYILTGSVAFLSDAAESVVNVIAAFLVIYSMRVALRPADYQHPYGHSKAEYLSSALEGGMILVAAGIIIVTSIPKLIEPELLSNIRLGIIVSLVAAITNALLALLIRKEARRVSSAALESNASHLMTDVWTSLGVIAAVLLIMLSGWPRLDPIIAIIVALNIIREGLKVLNRSISRLMDERLPESEERRILDILNAHPEVLGFHRLRTRQAGFGRFAELDIFVDPKMSVSHAHELVVELENRIHGQLPNLLTTIHVEPFEPGKRDSATEPKDEYTPVGHTLKPDTPS
ncbi:MAG: cation transporter [Trueperaceae bacterium]|nr:cation transporter [Trueperaceae bacterium]